MDEDDNLTIDRHDKNVWIRTIDSVVSLAGIGKDFQRPDDSSPSWFKEKPVNPDDYMTRSDKGSSYQLPSGNVVLDYIVTVEHHPSGSTQVMSRRRHIEVLKPENPQKYTPSCGTATALFLAERSITEPKFKWEPRKDRWRVGHVEDRAYIDNKWYDELLRQAETEAKRVAQIIPQP